MKIILYPSLNDAQYAWFESIWTYLQGRIQEKKMTGVGVGEGEGRLIAGVWSKIEGAHPA